MSIGRREKKEKKEILKIPENEIKEQQLEEKFRCEAENERIKNLEKEEK